MTGNKNALFPAVYAYKYLKWYVQIKGCILSKSPFFMQNLHISETYKWLCFRVLVLPLNALLSIKTGRKIFLFFFDAPKTACF